MEGSIPKLTLTPDLTQSAPPAPPAQQVEEAAVLTPEERQAVDSFAK